MRKWFYLFLLILIAVWLSTAIVSVNETEFVVHTRFGGRVLRTIEVAGPRLKLPWPIDQAVRVDRRRRIFLGQPDELITSDGHNVRVATYVLWEVADPEHFVRRLPGLIPAAEMRLSSHVTGLIGAFVSETKLATMVNTDPEAPGLREITELLTDQIRARTEEDYGIRILDFRLRRLTFPEQNRADIFDRMREERQVLINRYRTEGGRIADTIRSDADREAQISRAKAREEADVVRGQGEAEAARIYNLASEQNPDFYRFTQELLAMQKIYDKEDTLVVPSDWAVSHLFFEEKDETP